MTGYRSLAAVQADLAAGTLTCEALVQGYLQKVAARPSLNAFLEVWADEALAQARAQDARRAAGGALQPLEGMVLGVKDNIVWRGHRVSAASRMLEGYESPFSATALERLHAQGALFIGRTNCDEFAMGSSNENSAFGPVRLPQDEARVPGGSSGGSAAAVAAGLCLAALGTDTGGSVRQPAALCGLVGLKPTYGRISRYGLIAFGSSFDQLGTFTHTAEDAARLLAAMAGVDPNDNTSAEGPAFSLDAARAADGSPKRIGVLADALEGRGLEPEVAAAQQALIEQLRAAGHSVEVVDFPFLDVVVPTYYVLTTAEASSNLSRYDGVRYGYRSPRAETLDEVFRFSRSEGFGPEVQRRILLGTFVLSAGYYDAYYTQAMRVRRLILDHTRRLFEKIDFLLSPTSPQVAWPLGHKNSDPIAMYLSDIFTVHANLTGQPALSLPLATGAHGLPVGMHLLANHFEEAGLLRFGQALLEGAGGIAHSAPAAGLAAHS